MWPHDHGSTNVGTMVKIYIFVLLSVIVDNLLFYVPKLKILNIIKIKYTKVTLKDKNYSQDFVVPIIFLFLKPKIPN